MVEPQIRETPRSGILTAVLGVHLGLIAVALLAPAARVKLVAADPPLQLLFIPPIPISQVRADNHPQRLSIQVAIAAASPVMASALPGASSGADRRESGVDWTAEAHRAIRAFEIRRDQTQDRALSAASSSDSWLPAGHHAGEQSKTASGDWIVWIDANCYQIASWHEGAGSASAAVPSTHCVTRDDEQRNP